MLTQQGTFRNEVYVYVEFYIKNLKDEISSCGYPQLVL